MCSPHTVAVSRLKTDTSVMNVRSSAMLAVHILRTTTSALVRFWFNTPNELTIMAMLCLSPSWNAVSASSSAPVSTSDTVFWKTG